jgi:hypothetical protein
MLEYIGGETGDRGMIQEFGRKKMNFNFVAGMFADLHANADALLEIQAFCVFDECGNVDVA